MLQCRCRRALRNKQLISHPRKLRPYNLRDRQLQVTHRRQPVARWWDLDTQWAGPVVVEELLPIGDLTLLTTEGSGVTANAGLGSAVIGVHTNVVSDDAAIGGWPMAIGISTIIRWMGRPTSFQTSNMQIHRSNKSRRRRRAPNMHLHLQVHLLLRRARG